MRPSRFNVEGSELLKTVIERVKSGPFSLAVTSPHSAGLKLDIVRSDYGGVVFATKWSLFSFSQDEHPDEVVAKKISASVDFVKDSVYKKFVRDHNLEIQDLNQTPQIARRIDASNGSFGPSSLTEKLNVLLEAELLKRSVYSFIKIAFNAERSDLHEYEVLIQSGLSFNTEQDNISLNEGDSITKSKYIYPDTTSIKENDSQVVDSIILMVEKTAKGLLPRKATSLSE